MSYLKKSKFLQYIEQLESETAWSDDQFPCFKCYKKGTTICRTIVGRICLSCIEKELRDFAKEENLKKWSLKKIIAALSIDGMLHNRLTVIWRFHEIWELFSGSQPETGRLLIMLVQNLGYIKPSPPAYLVRTSAVEACKKLGSAVLPFLLEMCSKNPRQLYTNIILSAVSIAPDDLKVRKLVEKAIKDSNPEIRKRAYVSISDNTSQWAAELMQNLKNDPDPLVKEFVKRKKTPETQKKKTDIMTPLEKVVNKIYSLDNLKTIYPIYLINFVKDNKIKQKTALSVNKLTKLELVRLFCKIFIDKKHFQIFMDSLQDDVKKILNLLVWEGEMYNVDTLKKRFGLELIVSNKKKLYRLYSGKLKPQYCIFQISTQNYYHSFRPSFTPYISLNDELREQFKNYLARPLDYNLIPVKKINKTKFLFQDQGQIISQLILFYTYIQQGNLKFAKNGDKILLTSIKHMSDYCSIKEFYDETTDKNLRYIRTKMIADLLLDIKKEKFTDPLDLLQIIANELLSQKASDKYILRELLLFHLKGIRYLSGGYNAQTLAENEKKVRGSLLNLIKEMPVSQWVSAENIIKYCSYRSKDFEIIDRKSAAGHLYFQRFYRKDYQWIKESVYYDRYMEVLCIPFIKSFMFLCAGIGILDIAYDLPKNEAFQEKTNPYLSVFDSLKYVRLTSLGAYLIGLSDNYDVKFEVKEAKAAKVTLDDQRLIINLDGPDTLKSLVLDKIADKISDTCFSVNYNSFLKSCSSKEDIRQKIRLFRENISSSPPKIWKEFINEIMNKINPMTEEQSMKVYKLKPNDELIGLIAKDKILKRYILKAEDFHIIIKSKHLRLVKARLEEFGYLLDKI